MTNTEARKPANYRGDVTTGRYGISLYWSERLGYVTVPERDEDEG